MTAAVPLVGVIAVTGDGREDGGLSGNVPNERSNNNMYVTSGSSDTVRRHCSNVFVSLQGIVGIVGVKCQGEEWNAKGDISGSVALIPTMITTPWSLYWAHLHNLMQSSTTLCNMFYIYKAHDGQILLRPSETCEFNCMFIITSALTVGLIICRQGYAKTTEPICSELEEGVGREPGREPSNSPADLDHLQ